MPFGKQPSFHRLETAPDSANWLGLCRLQHGKFGHRCPNFVQELPTIEKNIPSLNIGTLLHRIIVELVASKSAPQKKPKKVVVKPRGFPYLFLQMHRIGAGVNGFYPEMHVPKKYNNKQQLTSEEPDEV
jgi:hypothetical protein